MARIDELELKKQIRENRISRVYLLYGSEPYLISQYARQIEAKVASADFAEFNSQKFDEESSIDEIDNAVESLPMLSERKCVTVSNYNADSSNANTTVKMEQLLEDPPSTCVLIFKLTAVSVNEKKSAKWRNFINAVAKVGEVVEIAKRDENTLIKYLVGYAGKIGCELSQDLARSLVKNCGTELYRLTNELEKICAYTESGKISAETIEFVSSQTNETVVYRMTDALAALEFDKAFCMLDSLFYQREEPVSLLAAISGVYVDLYRARAALDSGINAMTLTPTFDYKGMDFKMKNAMKNCRKYSLAQLRQILKFLYQADKELKSTRSDGRTVIEKTMAKILLITAKR